MMCGCMVLLIRMGGGVTRRVVKETRDEREPKKIFSELG